MKNICLAIVLLCTSLYSRSLVYSVNPGQALKITQQLANEHIFVFISLDIPSIKKLYTYTYDDMLKHIQKQHTSQSRKVTAFITRIMKAIDPIYPMLYHTAPHVIGITRRSLGWSHLIRSSCYEHDIVQIATRYIIPIKIDENAKPLHEIKVDADGAELMGYDCVECNTGILYIGTIDTAQVIDEYVKQHPTPCRGIIYIDTDYQLVTKCEAHLKQQLPTIEIIGLHINHPQTHIDLDNFQEIDSYIQSATETIARQNNIFNRHPEIFSAYDIPIEYLNKSVKEPKR